MASDSEVSRFDARSHTTPMLSVYANGQARFNGHAVRRWLGDAGRVRLHTNIGGNRLGIAPGGEGRGSHSLTPGQGSGLLVSMMGPLRAFGVDHADLDSAVRCPLEYDEQEGLLIADLQPVVDAVGGRDE